MKYEVRRAWSLVAGCLALLAPLAGAQSEGRPRMTSREDAPNVRVVLSDGDRPILQYNARTVALPEGYLAHVAEGNVRYAKARSGYIHPLYGPDGEILTLDWSVDHPHHRGIYWAWPEVQFAGQTHDLHALQGVYSRPVGEPVRSESDSAARVETNNIWMWEDQTPIVFERVAITAHAPGEDGVQVVDLALRFEALADGVSLARRGTNLYGGLNTRLAPVANLKLQRHADDENAKPRRAWSWARGTWQGGKREVTLVILEHPGNPDFPGDWITYQELPWFQPAFPRADTRHALTRDKPLALRYRYLVIPGAPDDEQLAKAFDALAATEFEWNRGAPDKAAQEGHK
ncbi:MAG: PmoA family protein [Phycisphaerales bacterium]|nr:PmoA family protein [Phycisphaerales bacterium]